MLGNDHPDGSGGKTRSPGYGTLTTRSLIPVYPSRVKTRTLIALIALGLDSLASVLQSTRQVNMGPPISEKDPNQATCGVHSAHASMYQSTEHVSRTFNANRTTKIRDDTGCTASSNGSKLGRLQAKGVRKIPSVARASLLESAGQIEIHGGTFNTMNQTHVNLTINVASDISQKDPEQATCEVNSSSISHASMFQSTEHVSRTFNANRTTNVSANGASFECMFCSSEGKYALGGELRSAQVAPGPQGEITDAVPRRLGDDEHATDRGGAILNLSRGIDRATEGDVTSLRQTSELSRWIWREIGSLPMTIVPSMADSVENYKLILQETLSHLQHHTLDANVVTHSNKLIDRFRNEFNSRTAVVRSMGTHSGFFSNAQNFVINGGNFTQHSYDAELRETLAQILRAMLPTELCCIFCAMLGPS
ncbi:hypothetical protein GALMADRAFT_811552 [Galerina marginata CBS 339.88]|uniref:Uncharacterized protein n=1 Tax=Galerina marginata (strain CBS 339.88) TaxID=685588 RepID=A0A067SIV3_GALM3|nr:hypothetical protein GALMADRAFT_811552 [Galerina marginata CBS 339.88]